MNIDNNILLIALSHPPILACNHGITTLVIVSGSFCIFVHIDSLGFKVASVGLLIFSTNFYNNKRHGSPLLRQ